MQNALLEHSAILLTFIKLPFVFNTFVLSIFDWSLKTGFTVYGSVIEVMTLIVFALSHHALYEGGIKSNATNDVNDN